MGHPRVTDTHAEILRAIFLIRIIDAACAMMLGTQNAVIFPSHEQNGENACACVDMCTHADFITFIGHVSGWRPRSRLASTGQGWTPRVICPDTVSSVSSHQLHCHL